MWSGRSRTRKLYGPLLIRPRQARGASGGGARLACRSQVNTQANHYIGLVAHHQQWGFFRRRLRCIHSRLYLHWLVLPLTPRGHFRCHRHRRLLHQRFPLRLLLCILCLISPHLRLRLPQVFLPWPTGLHQLYQHNRLHLPRLLHPPQPQVRAPQSSILLSRPNRLPPRQSPQVPKART